MNILVLNWLDLENPQAGGAEVHLHEVFGRLASRGWGVTAVTSGWEGCTPRQRIDGIDIHRVGRRHTYPIAAGRYVRGSLRGSFHVTVEDLNKAPLFTPLWLRGPHLLLVHHLFGAAGFLGASPPVALATWMLERPLPRIYRRVPVVAVSDSTREDLVARGFEARAISVAENGVDTERHSPGTIRFPEPTLLYLGRLKRYKRVDLVLEAVARLRERGSTVRLLIAGSGDDEGRLRALANRLGLGGRAVRFLGFVSESEKLELLRRAWVHVLTSTKEGWGITNLEAGACGTPSVVSDSPGLRDSVLDGETGFLVPHADIDGLVARLDRLLRDPELRETMGRRARAFAERFTWDRTADLVEDALRSAVVPQRSKS